MRMHSKSARPIATAIGALGAAAVLALGCGSVRPTFIDTRASAGRVLWKGDGESRLAAEWAEYSTGPHCAVTSDAVSSDRNAFRSSVKAKGSYGYEFVVHDGDACYGERAELGQALPSRADFTGARLFNDGDDRWISFAVRPGRDFPTGTRRWNVIAQWKQLAVPGQTLCCPILAMEVHNGRYYLDNAGRGVWRGPRAVRGRWARFTLHIKFSTDAATGFVKIWGDPDGRGMRRLLARRSMPTLSRTVARNAVPSHARIGIYRDSAINGTAHLYYDGYTVATTRPAAEGNAFARSRAPHR
jgi:hypothetical protein